MPSNDQTLVRRHAIPILYTKGTHYDVGYDVGRTFASVIQNFLQKCHVLNEEFLPAYETEEGRKVYEETLAAVNEHYPQYVSEIQGTADGAKVPFYKLFLMHMDVITLNASQQISRASLTGCSTVIVNQPDQEFLGHTEDAAADLLHNMYFVSAHIIPDPNYNGGKWGIYEERFTSLCYAGHLPGYTMGYNHHGVIFSINTLSAARLNSGKIPRHILTRTLLACENLKQAQSILKDEGCGAADGCSINMTFLNEEGERLFYNFEMGPANPGELESQLNMKTIPKYEYNIHCNRYMRLPVKEPDDFILENSDGRMEVLEKFPPPICKEDVIRMLGDQSGTTHWVFQDYGKSTGPVTLAAGIFDCKQKTWSIYSDNPKHSEPLMVLPLVLKDTKKCDRYN